MAGVGGESGFTHSSVTGRDEMGLWNSRGQRAAEADEGAGGAGSGGPCGVQQGQSWLSNGGKRCV